MLRSHCSNPGDVGQTIRPANASIIVKVECTQTQKPPFPPGYSTSTNGENQRTCTPGRYRYQGNFAENCGNPCRLSKPYSSTFCHLVPPLPSRSLTSRFLPILRSTCTFFQHFHDQQIRQHDRYIIIGGGKGILGAVTTLCDGTRPLVLEFSERFSPTMMI